MEVVSFGETFSLNKAAFFQDVSVLIPIINALINIYYLAYLSILFNAWISQTVIGIKEVWILLEIILF